jgi:FlaA1/EpsC-like NDP-sugar epimerase
MKNIIMKKNFWVILLIDITLLVSSYYLAFYFRFEGRIPAEMFHLLKMTILPVIIIKVSSFLFFDLYKGMWRYTGINDLLNIIKATVLSIGIFILYLVSVYSFLGISRSVIIADAMLTIFFIGGSRLSIRMFYQMVTDISRGSIKKGKHNLEKRVLIVGTGPLAERISRELSNENNDRMIIAGFIDETGSNKGMKIHGIPILGPLKEINKTIQHLEIDDVFIALPGMKPESIREIIDACSGLRVSFKVIPSFEEIINGRAATQLRELRIEDLLNRDPVYLDMSTVSMSLKGKVVLVTGGAGSIGSELARQILSFSPSQLILLDNAETPLFNIEMELKEMDVQTEIIPCIGDIRTTRGLERIFNKYHPEFIYHAAAYKHVPLMEIMPIDAVNNNILGTYKLATVAMKYGAHKFVMISTDKAVKPSSVMGVTKRIAEMVVQSLNGKGTIFSVVRFGNVLGSNGSVVPIFEKQIKGGGPVKITHPDVTRYFMTIREASMLVLQAGAMSKGGELFLLDMGSPVKIVDLARSMIRLAGHTPDKDIKIVYTSLRPGEKLHEELLIYGEDVVQSVYEKIKVCTNSNGFDKNLLMNYIEQLELLVNEFSEEKDVMNIINTLVPAYKQQDNTGIYSIKSITYLNRWHGNGKSNNVSEVC